MEIVHQHIIHSLSRKNPGDLIFPTDFRGIGTEAAIKKSLSRLAKIGPLKRLAHGIYYIPKTDPVLGELHPGAEEIAEMLARKEEIRIRPAGAAALHKLGLTTQVPMKLVYITDGPPRQLKIGKLVIKFKPTSRRKLSTKGRISSLVIQALEELDLKHMDTETKEKIKSQLLQENPIRLRQDLQFAPARINDFIVKLLKPNTA
ncbi:MAG: DUF6088 family protein [Puia sp.]